MGSPFLKRLEFFESQERELMAGLEQDIDKLAGKPNKRQGILARLLRFEERAFADKVPKGIEYEFGYRRPPALLGKISLRGYIDRFDQDRQDEDRLYIYDYKTGRPFSSVLVKKGLSFQLPVYIKALKSGADIMKKISGAIYSLRKEDFFNREEPLLTTIRDNARGARGLDISGVSLMDDYADQLMENMENGCFHHSADGIRCDYCEFKHACHQDPRRMEHLLDSGVDQHIYSGMENLNKWKAVDQFKKDWKKVSESMKKSLELKTESARKRHFESVLNFKEKILNNRDSLPFHDDYIDGLILKIGKYEKDYSSKSLN
jgi:ATP-dependent helicase/DNAse subunit B